MTARILAALAALSLLLAHPLPASATDYPANVQKARAWAQRTLGHVQFRCLDSIAAHESGWNPHAGSLSSSYGIAQAWPASKYASAGVGWRDDPMVQTRWMVGYVHARYGTACAAWSHWQRWGSY